MPKSANIDHYKVLGVTRDAAEEEIKQAFERWNLKFKASGKPKNLQTVEEVRAVVTAYRVLSDAGKRRTYDRAGHSYAGDSVLTQDKWAGIDPLEHAKKRRRKANSTDW